MTYDHRFGPHAQTPQQRANVLRQMHSVHPKLKAHATAQEQKLFDRYVTGELSWADVRRALDDSAA